MAQRRQYPFKSRDGRVGRLLVTLRLAPRHKHIPVFGVQGAGKSYFLLSLAQFISRRRLGRVVGESADYVTQLLPVMLRGDPLDATAGYRDIDLEVQRVYQADYFHLAAEPELSARSAGRTPGKIESQAGEQAHGDDQTVPCNFLLSTNDLPGAEFQRAMERLRDPTASFGEDPQTKRFADVINGAHGAIVVIDVVGSNVDRATFRLGRIPYVRDALSRQLVPLTRAIEMSVGRGQAGTRTFPLFLVFTKQDVHEFSRHELWQIVQEVFAIQLARLEDRVRLRIHAVQSIGFGVDANSPIEFKERTEGIGLFLADVHRSIEQM